MGPALTVRNMMQREHVYETAKAKAASAYIPSLQRTAGQPPPIAAQSGPEQTPE